MVYFLLRNSQLHYFKGDKLDLYTWGHLWPQARFSTLNFNLKKNVNEHQCAHRLLSGGHRRQQRLALLISQCSLCLRQRVWVRGKKPRKLCCESRARAEDHMGGSALSARKPGVGWGLPLHRGRRPLSWYRGTLCGRV